MGDENIDMIFVRFIILLINGEDNPFVLAQSNENPLSDKGSFNPKYFNLNCYYFEDIWNILRGINPRDIDEGLLLDVRKLLDNVARFEFRGAGSILTDCFLNGGEANPENIYNGINRYVSLLNRFCTRAKLLHSSELFQSFLSQVPELPRSPPPQAPPKPTMEVMKADKGEGYKAALKKYKEQIKTHRIVELPSELEGILTVAI